MRRQRLTPLPERSTLEIIGLDPVNEDREYFDNLRGLKSNESFKRELIKRRLHLMNFLAMVPIEAANYDRAMARLQGQIMAVNWCLHKLPEIEKVTEKGKHAESTKHRRPVC